MKRLLLGSSVVAVLLLFASTSYAERITVNGYQIDVQVTSNGGGLIQALGRVDSGAPCKKLLVTIEAQNEHNNITRISGTVDDVGNGGGRVLNVIRRSYVWGSIWRVINAGTSCVQN